MGPFAKSFSFYILGRYFVHLQNLYKLSNAG